MKIVGSKIVGGVLAAVAASGLAFATSAPAAAHPVTPHWHCLWTPDGWVAIAEGVSDYAPNDPALANFHDHVHRGEPGTGGTEQLIIQAIFSPDVDCEDLAPPSAVQQ
jgi:hypothetical protein